MGIVQTGGTRPLLDARTRARAEVLLRAGLCRVDWEAIGLKALRK